MTGEWAGTSSGGELAIPGWKAGMLTCTSEWQHPRLCCCFKLLAGMAARINPAFQKIPLNKSLGKWLWAGYSSLWVQVKLSGWYSQVTALRVDSRMDTCTHIYLSYLGRGKKDYLDYLFRIFFFWKALCLEVPERMRQTGCLHGPMSKKKALLLLPGDIQEGKCN